MFELNWFDFVVIILATFRVTHLIVFDTITSFIRNPFYSIELEKNDSGQMEQVIYIKGTGIRYFIGLLLSCYWCVGFWVSLFLVLGYFYIPILYPVLLVFAVAGAASILEAKV